MTSVAGVTRSYDNAGNTATIGTAWTFTHGAAGRMMSASDGTNTVSYMYTGAGEQVKRQQGSTVKYFVYDEAGQLLGQYDGSGAPIQQYIWMDNLPVGVRAGTQLLHVQPDHLGSPRAIIDPARNVAVWTWPILGEAFGNTPANEDPDNDSTAFQFDLRFPGQRHDVLTGLNYNYFRDYDSARGRYVQSDPIGLQGGLL